MTRILLPRGVRVWRRAAGLLTRGALPHRLPSPWASGMWRGSVSPHSGGTVPDSHRIPLPLAVIGREPIMGRRWPRPRPHALAPGRRLGGAHLRALVGAEPLDRSRHLGHGAAQGRARDGVRDPGRAALRALGRERRLCWSASPTRRPTSSTSTSCAAATHSPVDVADRRRRPPLGMLVSASPYNLGVPERKDLADRQLEAILERLDRLARRCAPEPPPRLGQASSDRARARDAQRVAADACLRGARPAGPAVRRRRSA